MIPPYWLWVRIAPAARSGFRLWFPLFLLWPIWLLLGLLYFAVLILLVWLWPVSRRARAWLLMPPRAYAVLCALRGLSVDVSSPKDAVRVFIL